jgi:hypothetical protein
LSSLTFLFISFSFIILDWFLLFFNIFNTVFLLAIVSSLSSLNSSNAGLLFIRVLRLILFYFSLSNSTVFIFLVFLDYFIKSFFYIFCEFCNSIAFTTLYIIHRFILFLLVLSKSSYCTIETYGMFTREFYYLFWNFFTNPASLTLFRNIIYRLVLRIIR